MLNRGLAHPVLRILILVGFGVAALMGLVSLFGGPELLGELQAPVLGACFITWISSIRSDDDTPGQRRLYRITIGCGVVMIVAGLLDVAL